MSNEGAEVESELDRVMVDIETLGIGPGAAIVSIGAVRFGPDGIIDTFEMSIDLVSCERAGLTIDAETVQWWMKQDDAAREQLAGGTRLDLVLRQFSEWYDNADEIWANSPAFDCAMLKAAYEAEGLNEPWYFYEERDVRTVKNLPVAADFEFQGVEHNALDDAVHQAEVVAQTLQFMQTYEHEPVTDGGVDQSETDDDHGNRAIYCEEAERYVLGRTPEGECPFCSADLTGKRYDRLQKQVKEHGGNHAE